MYIVWKEEQILNLRSVRIQKQLLLGINFFGNEVLIGIETFSLLRDNDRSEVDNVFGFFVSLGLELFLTATVNIN